MAKLLECGEVEIVCSDDVTRQIAVRISAPWCIVQAAVATLLGHGFVDALRVRQPMVAWTPPIPKDHFSDAALAEIPNIAEKVSAVVQDRVTAMLQLFADLASVLKNPDEALNLLPMGVYVTFQFRSTYENLAEVVSKLEPCGVPGVLEFRYALASVLAEALAAAGDVKSDVKRVPPVLGAPMTLDAADPAAAALPAQGQNFLGKNGRK
jgi:hypothetical protein